MSKQKQISVVEQIDKIMQRIALGVFLVAMAYAMSAAEFFVKQDMADILNNTSTILGLVAIVLVLPGFLRLVSLKRKNREACREPEGFVVEVFNQSTGKAFQFTFIFLLVLEILNKAYLGHLPGEFFIKLIVSVTLTIFSLYFFFLNRAGADTEPDDDFSNGEQP